jgi:microcystin-dependent protein
VYGTTANVEMGAGTVTINNNGGNLPFNNRNPYEVVNYIIALFGTYPSRN